MPKSKISHGESKRVNKSAWIRSQPTTLSAKEVVAKAKSEDIKLSVAQVYTARSTAKQTPQGASQAVRGRRSPRSATRPAPQQSEMSFRRFVLTLGLDRVESMLAQIKREAGL
ncbi:MAG TPA: hypothetical protein VJV78_02080 [Polyangiales bacterium]|nr:hypothetical protein [Polyangiales bacterium]